MDRLAVICRPARESDTPAVIELTKTIWDGHDYVPEVWSKWLVDPEGQLLVAEAEGRVLGLGKLTRLSEEDWWFEGLRVHPEYQGRGIAAQINDYMVQLWLQIGGGTVRLATASFNHSVRHMSEQSGFEKMTECTFFVAPAEGQGSPAMPEEFQAVNPGEVTEATTFISSSSSLAWSAGLIDLSWKWAPPREAYLARIIEKRKALWWRGRQGLVTFTEDTNDKGETVPLLLLLACSEDVAAQCLREYRQLAGALGYAKAAWLAPLLPEVLLILEATGYQRDWEDSLYIYTLKHPTAG